MKKFALVINTAYSDDPCCMATAEVLGIYDTEEEARTQMADFEEGIREDDFVFDTISHSNSLYMEAKNWVYYARVMDTDYLVRKLLRTLNPDVEPKDLNTVVNFAFGIAACERDLVDVLMETLHKKNLVPVF